MSSTEGSPSPAASAVPPEDAAAALTRVLGSTTFAGSARHRAFLEAIGRHPLGDPQAEPLKEFALGVDVFGRSPDDFDPQVDNIVRVEARRLRDRLRQYYETAGREDPVVIDVPRGGYGATCSRRPTAPATVAPAGADRNALTMPAPPAATVPALPRATPPESRRWSPVASLLMVALVALAGFAVSSMSRAMPAFLGLLPGDATATVAVLPVTNLTQDPAIDPFIDVLSDDLSEALSRVPGVRVTARGSTLAFRAPARDLRAVGTALGVRHVVEGSVDQSGDALTVVLRVARTSDAREIWTATYRTTTTQMFAVAQEAATAVLAAIDTGLDRAAARSDVTSPNDPRAREAYARGRYFVRLATVPGYQSAVQAFDECRRIEPDFGRCHSGWGHAKSTLDTMTGSATPENVRAAERATARAAELEPGNATALANLGGFDILYRYDWPAARRRYLRAVQISPRLSLEAYAGGLALVGRFDEAVALFRKAQEWDPLSLALRFKIAGVFAAQGRLDEALAEYAVVDTIAPDHPSTHYARAMIHLRRGELEAMQTSLAAFKRTAPGWPTNPAVDAIVLANTGRQAEARQVLQSFEASAGATFPFLVGVCYAQLHQPVDAARWLLRAIAQHDQAAATLIMESGLDPIRDTPEFRAVWDAVPRLTTDTPFPGGGRRR